MNRIQQLAIAAGVFTVTAPCAHGQWLEVKAEHYSVFYQAGFEKDTAFARTWADRAEQLMRDKYGVKPAHHRMSIYLFPAPTATIDVNTARNRCCTWLTGTDSSGTIEMVTPSAPAMQAATAISSLGMPKSSESYQAKILMSEYIPIGHFEVQSARPGGGWKYYKAPNWFVQGLQEYDAIFHTTDVNRTETVKQLSAWAVANKAVFSCCDSDIVISDAYNGGASFVMFLAAEYGEAVHAKLLRSSAATFADALTEVTKPLTRAQLFARFQTWLQNGARPR